MLPRTSPTKATSGVALVSAGRQSPASVSDRRPAPTKATPPGALSGKPCLPRITLHPRPQNVGKFISDGLGSGRCNVQEALSE